MRKLPLFAMIMFIAFACTTTVDEEPIDLNEKGEALCLEDGFGGGCIDIIDDPGPGGGGTGGGGTGGTGGGNSAPPPPIGTHFIAFMKGKNSSNINHAITTNSPSAWQNYGGTPGAWQTQEGPGVVLFHDEVYMFHVSNSSEKVIQSHAEFDSNGNLSWQTTNSNIELGNGARTHEAVSAAVWKDRIWVASKSVNNDAIYVSRSFQNDGTQYESTAELAVTESENDGGAEDTFPFDDVDGWPPYLTVFQDKLYVFWVKRTTNSVFYKVKETLNGTWSARVEVTGIQHGERREAKFGVAATEHNGKLYIVYPSKLNHSLLARQVLPVEPGIQNMTSLSNADSKSRPSMASDGTNLMVVYRDEKDPYDDDVNNDIYYSYMNGSGTWITNQKAKGSSKQPPYVLFVDGN